MKNDISKFAQRDYNDELERDAARDLIYNNKKFRVWLIAYAMLSLNMGPFRIISNPLKKFTKNGKPCGVDLGLIDKNGTIVCLIEVDVLFGWINEFPSHFYCLSRWQRKTKFWEDNSYPYINISFSANHKNGIMTTREIEIKYPPVLRYFPEHNIYEDRREISLSEGIKVGEWANDI